MLKKSKLIVAATLATMLPNLVFADGGTRSRSWCAWGDRYQAWTSITRKIDYYKSQAVYKVYQQVGTDPLGRPVWAWVTVSAPPTNQEVVCSGRNVGCTRPKSNNCSYSYQRVTGMDASVQPPIYYYANANCVANIELTFSGENRSFSSNSPTLKPGIFEDVPVDSALYFSTNKEGSASANIDGKIELNPTGDGLSFQNLNGYFTIANGSNYYSTLRVLVVKENTQMSAETADALDADMKKLIFHDVVADGSVTLSSNGVQTTGILADVFNGQNNVSSDDSLQTFSFEAINTIVNLNRQELGVGEEFTVITYVDGGFDYTLVNDYSQSRNALGVTGALKPECKVYPNPATETVTVQLPENLIGQKISIVLTDIAGRTISTLPDEVVKSSSIPNLSVADLTPGVYFASIRHNSGNFKVKFVKN